MLVYHDPPSEAFVLRSERAASLHLPTPAHPDRHLRPARRDRPAGDASS